jgi:hypothetical protein
MYQAFTSIADVGMPCLLLMCRLIKANRQTGRSSLSSSIQTPWGQPEPATRDLHSKAGSPRQQAQPVSSQNGTAAADRYASSRDALNRVCMMSLPVCWCLACMDLPLLQLGPEAIAVVKIMSICTRLLANQIALACPLCGIAVWA